MRASIFLAILLLACEQRSPLERFAQRIEGLRDDMCRCTEPTCVATVDKALASYNPDDRKADLTIDREVALNYRIERASSELVECKRKATGDDRVAARLIAKMAGIADRFCACTDRSCVQALESELTGLEGDFSREFVASDDDKRKIAAIQRRLEKCAIESPVR